MDEGGKQLGAVVIAIVVVIALIAIAKLVFGSNGILKDKIEDELDKVTSSQVIYEVEMPEYLA